MALFLGEWLFEVRDRVGTNGLLLGWGCECLRDRAGLIANSRQS